MRTMARKPTDAELAEAMSRKPVYKVVRKRGNGQLVSLWVEGTAKHPRVSTNHQLEEFTGVALHYSRMKLTGNGRYGIFCCRTLEDAMVQSRCNGCGRLCLIFKAYPLGTEIDNTSGFGDCGTVLYPSIILDKRIVKLVDYRHGYRYI